MLTEKDLSQLAALGISEKQIGDQLANFRTGFPYVQLDRPATAGDGIRLLTAGEAAELASLYDRESASLNMLKFVPASGAASRMFKSLFTFLEWYRGTPGDRDRFAREDSFDSAFTFISNLHRFAFTGELQSRLEREGTSLEDCLEKAAYHRIIETLIGEQGLNYGKLPKGLLSFHRYDDGPRTAIEEHLVEATHFCRDAEQRVKLHFTLSPEHVERFLQHAGEASRRFGPVFGVHFDLSHSMQDPSTDTIAADSGNQPFREPDGSLVFRPGGHGALLKNLNALSADVIFIKNIDNIVPDRWREPTILYKKALGGLLLQIRSQLAGHLRALDEDPSPETTTAAIRYAGEVICPGLDGMLAGLTLTQQQERLHALLNKPVRVCGMVRNEGEPGGGPFWVKELNGQSSLQIVESSQVDPHDAGQQAILRQATHFNPVDLVVSICDYRGRKFDLQEFVDPSTGFISLKSKDGKTLKAQELPGLWNGAMAKWITLFVEVPLITFNPVKVINDLLREPHQS